jgi:hypothetical protein
VPFAPIHRVNVAVRVDVSLAHLDDPDYVEDPPPDVFVVVAGYDALGALVGESAFPIIADDTAAALRLATDDFRRAFTPSPEVWARRDALPGLREAN